MYLILEKTFNSKFQILLILSNSKFSHIANRRNLEFKIYNFCSHINSKLFFQIVVYNTSSQYFRSRDQGT